jgi:hypothetical protein
VDCFLCFRQGLLDVVDLTKFPVIEETGNFLNKSETSGL